MITQDQSDSFFNERMKPVLQEVEVLRKKVLEKGKRNKLFLSGFGILIFLYTYTAVQEWADTPMQKFWMSALLIIILVTAYISIRPEIFLPRNERNRIYKLYTNGVVREMVRFINKTFNYHPIFKTNIRLFERSELFADKITAYQETYGIVGRIGENEIRISEVELRHDSSMMFQGWFAHFDKEILSDDFAIFSDELSIKQWETKADFEQIAHDKFKIFLKKGKKNALAKNFEKILAHYHSKIGQKIQLAVVDKRLYLVIGNDTKFFQLSYRDDNNNYFGVYMDFNRMGVLTNFIEEISHSLEMVQATR